MKLKKIVVLGIAGILVLGSVSGCGNEERDTIQQNKSEVKQPENKKPEADNQISGIEDEETENEEIEDEETELKESSEFKITAKMYQEGNIKIAYPQVENLVNQEITDWYNQQFKHSLEIYTGEAEEGDIAAASENVNETFKITYQSEDMISILVEGYFYAEGAAHPYAYMNSYNINLKTGESMGITDEYAPEEIVNDLLAGKNYTPITDVETMTEMTGEELDYLKQEIAGKDREFTLESMEKCDYDFRIAEDGTVVAGEEAVYVHSIRLADGSWGIGLETSHALGDYVIVKYSK